MAPAFSMNDGVLLMSLLYLSIDMQYQWQEFESCHWPVHRWLLVSYFFIVAFRTLHILGTMNSAATSEDFLLNLRHKDALPKLLLSITWLVILPLYAAWTGVGTYWLWDSKQKSSRCLPMGMPLAFIATWQALSYAWIVVHSTLGGIAWVLERRVRRAEASLRAMQDSDTTSRWGNVSQLSGYSDLVNNSMGGLTPDQIHALPEAIASELKNCAGEEMECSICLNDIEEDDAVRQLCGCGHTFHRACIDLWLLRRADCPLCKQNVLASGEGASKSEVEHWHV